MTVILKMPDPKMVPTPVSEPGFRPAAREANNSGEDELTKSEKVN